MTDLEINKKLALAIGYKEQDFIVAATGTLLVPYKDKNGSVKPRNFHYKDWNIAGPLAEHYEAFPSKAYLALHPVRGPWVTAFGPLKYFKTPQEAIAHTIIGEF